MTSPPRSQAQQHKFSNTYAAAIMSPNPQQQQRHLVPTEYAQFAAAPYAAALVSPPHSQRGPRKFTGIPHASVTGSPSQDQLSEEANSSVQSPIICNVDTGAIEVSLPPEVDGRQPSHNTAAIRRSISLLWHEEDADESTRRAADEQQQRDMTVAELLAAQRIQLQQVSQVLQQESELHAHRQSTDSGQPLPAQEGTDAATATTRLHPPPDQYTDSTYPLAPQSFQVTQASVSSGRSSSQEDNIVNDGQSDAFVHAAVNPAIANSYSTSVAASQNHVARQFVQQQEDTAAKAFEAPSKQGLSEIVNEISITSNSSYASARSEDCLSAASRQMSDHQNALPPGLNSKPIVQNSLEEENNPLGRCCRTFSFGTECVHRSPSARPPLEPAHSHNSNHGTESACLIAAS